MMKGTYFSVQGEKTQTEAAKAYNQELNINSMKTGVCHPGIQDMAVLIKWLQV